MMEANLRGVNLCGANLALTDLSGADLGGAVYNEATTWPGVFFNPRRRGCVRAAAEVVPAAAARGRGDEVVPEGRQTD